MNETWRDLRTVAAGFLQGATGTITVRDKSSLVGLGITHLGPHFLSCAHRVQIDESTLHVWVRHVLRKCYTGPGHSIPSSRLQFVASRPFTDDGNKTHTSDVRCLNYYAYITARLVNLLYATWTER